MHLDLTIYLYAYAFFLVNVLDANGATADFSPQVSSLDCFAHGSPPLIKFLDGGQPETVFVGEVVASAARAVALDEGRGAEIFQTAAGAGQRLAASTRTSSRVLLHACAVKAEEGDDHKGHQGKKLRVGDKKKKKEKQN